MSNKSELSISVQDRETTKGEQETSSWNPFRTKSNSFHVVDISSISLPYPDCDNVFESLSQQEILTRIYQTCLQSTANSRHSSDNKSKERTASLSSWWRRWLLPWTYFSSPSPNMLQTDDDLEDISDDGDEIYIHNSLLGIPTIWGYEDRIPPEAHPLARLWLASTVINKTIRICKPSVNLSPTPSDTVLAVCGWGDFVEFPLSSSQDSNTEEHNKASSSRAMETSDKQALLSQAHGNRQSSLLPAISLVRACRLGSNLVAISYGLDDGIIVIYKKLVMKTKMTSWCSIAILTPSNMAIEAWLERFPSADDMFQPKRRRLWSVHSRSHDPLPIIFQSGMMRVSEIVSIHDRILVVSRISGCVEIIVIPIEVLNQVEVHETRNLSSHHIHYAHDLPDLTYDPRCFITPLVHTLKVHTDIITLAAYPRRSIETGSFRFILACTGGQRDEPTRSVLEPMNESVSLWNISMVDNSMSSESVEQPWTVDIILVDKVPVKERGPPVTTFVNVSSNSWIHDQPFTKKRVRLFSEAKAVLLSSSPPICSLQFHNNDTCPAHTMESPPCLLLSIMDYNGGVSLVNCSKLVIEPSQSIVAQVQTNIPVTTSLHLTIVMTRDIFLSSLFPVIGLDSIIGFSLTFNRDEAIVTALTRSCTFGALKIRFDTCDAVILDAKEVYRENDRLFGSLVTVDLTSFTRFVFLSSPVDKHVLKVSLSALEHLSDQSLLADFLRQRKYDDALALVECSSHNTFSDNDRDECYKCIWENKGDIFSLKKVSDLNYLFSNVINMSDILPDEKTLAVADVLSLYLVTLKKLDAKYISSDNQCLQGIDRDHSTNLLWTRHRYLETLLNLSHDVPPAIPVLHLRSWSHLESLVHVAKYFAREGDLQSLSIVMALNWNELGSNSMRIGILENLPLSLDVAQYAHLLPCYDEHSTFSWKAYEQKSTASVDDHRATADHIERGALIKSHVEKKYHLKIVQSDVVLTDNLLFDRLPNLDDLFHMIISWYLQRAKAMYRFTAQIETVIDFCNCGLSRCNPHQSKDISTSFDDYNEFLSLKAQLCRFREFIIYQTLNNFGNKLTLLEMHELGTDGVLNHFLKTHSYSTGPSDIINLVVQSKDCESSLPLSINYSEITSFCINALNDAFSSNTGDHNATLKALELCSFVVKSSSLSLPSSERLIKDDGALISFIAAVFAVISTNVLPSQAVSYLWTLYECLPYEPLDDKHSTFIGYLKQNIVAVDLLLKWMGTCRVVSISALPTPIDIFRTPPGNLNDPRPLSSIGYHISSRMALGFFDKLVTLKGDEHRRLLLQYVSDVLDLNEVCFCSSLSIAYIIEEKLFREALARNSFSIIREILLMPESLVNGGVLENYLTEHIRRITSGIKSFESYELLKKLHDMLGDICSLAIKEELDLSLRYFAYTFFLHGEHGTDFTTITFEDFRSKPCISLVRPLVKIALVKWVVENPKWIDSDEASVINISLFSLLFSDVLDIKQVKSERYYLDQALSQLVTVIGNLDCRDFILLRCFWIEAAINQGFLCVAVAFSSLLVYDMKSMITDQTALSFDNILIPVMDVIAQTLCTVLSKASAYNSILFHLGMIFLNSVRVDMTARARQQLFHLSDLLRRMELQFLRSYSDQPFGLYQRDVLTSASSLTCGRHSSPITLAVSKVMIESCVERALLVKQEVDSALSTPELQPREKWLDISLAVGFYDTTLHTDFIDNETNRIDMFIRENRTLMEVERPFIIPDEDIVKKLRDRGYSLFGAKRAAVSTHSQDFQTALRWAVEHSNDTTFNDRILLLKRNQSITIDVESIYKLYRGLKYIKYLRKSKPHVQNEYEKNRSHVLPDIQQHLKNLAESERKQLANEGRKLISSICYKFSSPC